jgi:pyruvate,water dikinase
VAEPPAKGAVLLGPGPVGETLPDPLSTLEIDLWVEPLRAGMAEALRVTNSARPRRLAASPVVTAVGGRVACDLELVGALPPRRPVLAVLSPRRGFHHLMSAWRVGRLRAIEPQLAADLVARIDAELASVGTLEAYADQDLVELLARARLTLVSLHAHQVLAGMVLPAGGGATAAAIALQLAVAARTAGLSDAELIERSPVVLTLLAPRVSPPRSLPSAFAPVVTSGAVELDEIGPREALRLRARWVQ